MTELRGWNQALQRISEYLPAGAGDEASPLEVDNHLFAETGWVARCCLSASNERVKYQEWRHACWLICGALMTEAYLGGFISKDKRYLSSALLVTAVGSAFISTRLRHSALVRFKAAELLGRIEEHAIEIVDGLKEDRKSDGYANARKQVEGWASRAKAILDLELG